MGLAVHHVTDGHQNWWQLFCIQMAGGIISIPVLGIGPQILITNGLINAILSIIIGNFIVLLISAGIILMSAKHRLNAVENAQQVIGKTGSRVLAFFILSTMVGWLARQISSDSDFLQLHPFFASFTMGPIIGAMSALILLAGIRGLKFICVKTTIPLLVLFFVIMSFGEQHSTLHDNTLIKNEFNFGGITLVLASLLASIVDYPTFFRHSKAKKDSIYAILAIFFVTVMLQTISIFLFKIFVFDKEVVLHIFHTDTLLSTALVLFLILSMISSCAWNMYAASVGWESLFPQFKGKTEYALIGLVAIVLFTNSFFEKFVISSTSALDIIISALAGILVFEFINRKLTNLQMYGRECRYNIISWGLGSSIGLLSYFNLINYPMDGAVISLTATFIITALIYKIRKIYRRFSARE